MKEDPDYQESDEDAPAKPQIKDTAYAERQVQNSSIQGHFVCVILAVL